MPTIVAKWPNGTFSIIRAPVGFSMTDLFWKLDEECDPSEVKLYMIKSDEYGWSHVTFDWRPDACPMEEIDEQAFRKYARKAGRLSTNSGKLRKFSWPHGILRQAYRALRGGRREDSDLTKMSAEELSAFPAEPSQTFSVEEVRSMDPFCGVYFSYNEDGSCHYVGESKNVTQRVTKSRDEIGGRRIGLVKCEPQDRKRIEAFYVAMLNPPGNAISTHRMLWEGQTTEGMEASCP